MQPTDLPRQSPCLARPAVTAVLVLVLTLLASNGHARMYQWETESGRPNLSGIPPAWYRTDVGGPRVLVFEQGQLIDDTAIAVSDAQRLRLYEDAFGSVAPDTLATAPAPLRAGDEDAPTAGLTLDLLRAAIPGLDRAAPRDASPTESQAPANPESTIERLKSIIDAWDATRTEAARAVMETVEP